MHILPNMSKNKENQTMKIGPLIQCNMRNIFPQKLYIKYGGENSPRLFSKESKSNISQDQRSEIL